jgi:FkbM family methyltransferase
MRPLVVRSVRAIAARCGLSIHRAPRGVVCGRDLWRDIAIWQPDARLIFDVGANVGQTVDEAKRRWPSAQVIAFEPSPRSFRALQARYAADSDVRLEPVALSDHEGPAPFHVIDDESYSVNDSLHRPLMWTSTKTIQVQVNTVDRYCTERGIEQIDVLKIDTQGHDLLVLQGARDILRRHAVGCVVAEVCFAQKYQGQPGLEDFLSFGREMGYTFAGLYEQSYWHNRLAYANLCWRRPAEPSPT